MAGRFFTTSTTWETQAWKQQIVASRDCLLLLKGWGHWTCWTVFRTIEAHWATLSGLLSRVWQNLFKARNADRHISALSPIPRLSPFSVLLLQSTQPGKLPFWNLFTGNQFWSVSDFLGYPPPEVLSHQIQSTCICGKCFVWPSCNQDSGCVLGIHWERSVLLSSFPWSEAKEIKLFSQKDQGSFP